MDVAVFRFTHQVFAVRHRETYVQIVPILCLADGADGREVPAHLIGQARLGNHFITAEQAADVVPLSAAIGDLAAGVEFQGAANRCRVTHFLDGLRAQGQWLVIQLIGRLHLVGGHKAVEVTLLGQRLVQRFRFLAVGLRQLQAARLPVTPAVGVAQFRGHPARQLVGFIPTAQAQQQARAPFTDGVVTQFRVVLGHDLQGAGIEALGQGQADFAGDSDLFLAGKFHPLGVAIEQLQRAFRVLAGQTAQAEANYIGHGRVGLGKARGLLQQLRFLRNLQQGFAVVAEGRHGLDQMGDQAIVARFCRQLGALPASLLSELAFGGPHCEQRVTGVGLGFADQPEFLGGGVAFGAHAVA